MVGSMGRAMDVRGRMRRLLEDRAQRRGQRQYEQAVEHWIAQLTDYQRKVSLLNGPGIVSGNAPIQLWSDEVCLGSWPTTLVAGRSTRVTNYAGASYRTSSHTSVRVGQARSVSTPDELTPIDQGIFVVTDHRFVFVGSTKSVTWDFRKLISITEGGGTFLFHVSNRQRTQGIGIGRGMDQQLRWAIEAGRARHDGSAAAVASRLVDEATDLLHTPPDPPPGIAVDERIAGIDNRGRGSEALERLEAAGEPHIRLALADVPISAVTAGFIIAGVDVPTVRETDEPTPDWDALEQLATERSASSEVLSRHPFVAVEAESADWLADQLDMTGANTVICAPEHVLAAAGLEPADRTPGVTALLGFAHSSLDDVHQAAIGNYSCAARLGGNAPLDPGTVAAVAAMGHLFESLGPSQSTIVVVNNAEGIDLPDLVDSLQGFDVIALVGTPADLEAAGIAIADQAAETEPDDEGVELSPVAALTIAAHPVEQPQQIVAAYLREHGGTVANYDFLAGTFTEITPELVRATRLMSSRISRQHEDWFIERGATADWASVDVDASLADADPSEADGLYDAAYALYAHFYASAPKGVGAAKVSKVLYLMRPHLVPILDTRLRKRYETAAKEAAKDLARTRESFAQTKWLYWEAIRRDIIANTPALDALRASMKDSNWGLASEAAERLSDLRLLDICTWVAGDDAAGED